MDPRCGVIYLFIFSSFARVLKIVLYIFKNALTMVFKNLL
jgi:hypothetical protein